MKDVSKEMDTMEMENRIRQYREDLPGDVLLSAQLLLAASEKKWSEVENLLAQGADPRICRWGDAYGIESALYFAFADQQWDVAVKLYDAGDRLDDLVMEHEEPLPHKVLQFLAVEMRCGKNYFLDESRTLSECCRCSAFVQIEKLMPSASREELNKSILPTVFSWRRYFQMTDRYMEVLEGLKSCGAKISEEDKAEALELFEKIKTWPAVMQPKQEDLERMVNFIRNA